MLGVNGTCAVREANKTRKTDNISSSNGWLHESFNKSNIALEPPQPDKRPLLPRMDHRHAVVKRAHDNGDAYKGGVAVWFTGRCRSTRVLSVQRLV